MASNYTENYGLCQWEATDQVLRTEFNEDNAAIDEALNRLAEQDESLKEVLEKHQCTLETLHNGRIYITSYVGTGSYGSESPVVVALPQKPEIIMVTSGGHLMIYAKGMQTALVWYGGGGTGTVTVSWEDNQISWYGTGAPQQMNDKGSTFYVLAFLKAA